MSSFKIIDVEIKKKYYQPKDIAGPYLLVNIKGGVGYYHV